MAYRIDARDAMDAHYGAGNWSYRTAPHVGSDLGVALNAAATAAKATYPRLDILIPPTGPWLQTTKFSGDVVTGNHLHGDGGVWGTEIHYDSDDHFFDIGYTGDHLEGGMIENLMVNLEEGHANGGVFLRVVAQDDTGAPGGYVFKHLRASTKDPLSSWLYSVAVHGMNKVSPAQGIRGFTMEECMMFCARVGGMWAAGINQAKFDNVAFAVPRAPGGADILIGGGGTPQTNSSSVYTNGLVTVGNISLANVDSVVGNMKSSGLTVDGTVTHSGIIHSGAVSGAVGSGFVTAI